MTECERCGWPLGNGEGRGFDGDYLCPLCVDELQFDPPRSDYEPPHVNHWAWEGERVWANGTR